MKNIAYKRLDKLTTVTLSRTKIDELQHFFRNNKPTQILPPLFSEYVIHITVSPEEMSRIAGRPVTFSAVMDVYVLHETPTTVYLLEFYNGKKELSVELDYNKAETRQDGSVFLPISLQPLASFEDWTEDEIKREAYDVINFYRYVTYYMLYYKPEVQYVDAPRRTGHRRQSPASPKRKDEFVLKSAVRRYTIGASEMPRDVKYSKLVWAVRGHYRRTPSGTLAYVSPHTARRRGAKDRNPNARKYRLE